MLLGNFEDLCIVRPRWVVGVLFGVCGVFLILLLYLFYQFAFKHNELGYDFFFSFVLDLFLTFWLRNYCEIFWLKIFCKNYWWCFFRLDAFCNVFGPRLHLFSMHSYHADSITNLLFVLLLNQFFLTQSIVLICCYCIYAKYLRSCFLSMSKVFAVAGSCLFLLGLWIYLEWSSTNFLMHSTPWLIFFGSTITPNFLLRCFCAKIIHRFLSIVCGFFSVVASCLLLLRLCVYLNASSTNILCVLLFVQFFLTQLLLLICWCYFSAKSCTCCFLAFMRVFLNYWFLLVFASMSA